MCDYDDDTSVFEVIYTDGDIIVYKCNNGDIGIKINGNLVVMPPLKWFQLARNTNEESTEKDVDGSEDEVKTLDEIDY